MTAVEGAPATRQEVNLLRAALLALVAFVVLKFLVLLADVDWDLARSPFVPLVLVLGFTLLLWRKVGRRRWAAAVALLLFVGFAVLVVAALARDGLERQSWTDYPFAYGGFAAAALGGLAAFRLLRRPMTTS